MQGQQWVVQKDGTDPEQGRLCGNLAFLVGRWDPSLLQMNEIATWDGYLKG